MYDPALKAKEVNKWVPKHGELARLEAQRYEYNLNPDSIVFDFGGFDGKWAETLFKKHKCNIYVFEPVSILFNACNSRLGKYPKIKVFNFGLAPSDEDQEVKISIEGDASSMFSNNTGTHDKKKTETCKLKSFSSFLKDNNIQNIDLVKMNIEGAEFDLLDYILLNNLNKIMNNIQIQFHEFMDDCINRRNNIINNLSKTHNNSWNYSWVLESWELK